MGKGFIMLPTCFIDELLPTLSDSEVRLYLVVARQTLGWKQGNRRKEWDRLSHRELKRRTGRSGTPISTAIASLQAKGMLRVRNGKGREINTAGERRAQYEALSYSLSEDVYPSVPPAGFQDLETTKQKESKETYLDRKVRVNPIRINKGWQRASVVLDNANAICDASKGEFRDS
jgi:hypothetical protein